MEDNDLIYGFFDDNRFLSNFFPVSHGVFFDDIRYPTVEHAYQAGKTTDYRQRRAIQMTELPGEAKRIGRRIIVRPDWEDFKLFHMEFCLRNKFKAGTRLGNQLLRTGSKRLVEANNWNDTFWGKCRGVGKNNLGELLMEIRDDLRNGYTTWKTTV